MTITPTHSGLKRLLTIAELSDYLGIPVATLYDWRVDGVGPQAVDHAPQVRPRLSAGPGYSDSATRDR